MIQHDKTGEAQRIMDEQKKQRDAGYLAGEIERDPFDILWLTRESAALIVEALRAFAHSAVLEPVLCDSATAVCSICQQPVEQHRDIESVRSAEPRSIAVLRGVSNLLRRCLTHGLLRAETEAMLLDIEAALTVAPTSSALPKEAHPIAKIAEKWCPEAPLRCIGAIEEAMALSATSAQEPAAWLEVGELSGVVGVSLERDNSSPFSWEPLYRAKAGGRGASG